MRIRAAGSAVRTPSDLSSGNSACSAVLAGTLRFEAILPNLSFQAAQIKPIPFLATPLANQLIVNSLNGAGTNRTTGSTQMQMQMQMQMGYLSMNQTRKLVPLLETDPSVSLVPLVGVWVKYEQAPLYYPSAYNSPSQASVPVPVSVSIQVPLPVAALLDHPFTWGACVRFLCSEHVQQRVLVANDTFLLVRIAIFVLACKHSLLLLQLFGKNLLFYIEHITM